MKIKLVLFLWMQVHATFDFYKKCISGSKIYEQKRYLKWYIKINFFLVQMFFLPLFAFSLSSLHITTLVCKLSFETRKLRDSNFTFFNSKKYSSKRKMSVFHFLVCSDNNLIVSICVYFFFFFAVLIKYSNILSFETSLLWNVVWT